MSKKILVVDDEADIVDILAYNLENAGYEVFSANNGADAVQLTKQEAPDFVLLDLMMPVLNGIQACKQIRQLPSEQLAKQPTILFLTALSDDDSEINALEAGADDFIVKPIRAKVLLTKIESLIKRTETIQQLATAGLHETSLPNLFIDREKFVINYEGQQYQLAKKEFELLSLLASQPNKVFLRNEILANVWGSDIIVGDRTIDVHIRKIRQKTGIDNIKTIKGVGYKFVPQTT